jgi:hypothetical protein
MTSADEVRQRLAELIVRYLAKRPNAADSLEGICDWWIPKQKLVEARKDVQEALDLLVKSGQVQAETTADGRILYRARRAGETASVKDESPPGES